MFCLPFRPCDLKALLTGAAMMAGAAAYAHFAPSAVAQTATQAAETKPASLTLDLNKGALLSIISVIPKQGEAADAARSEYYQTAFPLASGYGLQREGQLRVVAAPIGAHDSKGIIFFSWPSAEAEAALEAEAAWPGIKALRPKAWEDLRILTDELEDDLTLTFAPDKTYTLAMAWTNPENPKDYDRYMDGIEDAVASVGGRFVYKMFDPKFESHALDAGAPGQVTLVEWDSPQGLANFQETDGFKANAKYLTSGVTRFEVLVLSAQ